MKKTNFTFHDGITRNLLAFMMILSASIFGSNLMAQCSLSCNGTIHVSLDMQCQATLTLDMVVNDNATSCPGGSLSVMVTETIDGEPIPTSPVITSEYVGRTLYAKVLDSDSGNSCWGEVLVEDKMPPTITCPTVSGPIYCFAADNFVPAVEDNCDPNPTMNILNEEIAVNPCDGSMADNVIKRITRTYQAEDNTGRKSDPCTIEFDVVAIDDLSTISAPSNFILNNAIACSTDYPKDENGNPHVSYTGVPTLNGVALYPTPYAACNLVVTKEDVALPAVGCVKKLMRTFKVVEWSCGVQRERDIVQMIEIADNVPPVITNLPAQIEESTSHYECSGHVNLPAVEAYDACSETISVDIQYEGGFLNNQNGGLVELPVGENVVTYTVYDECYNSTTQTMVVWVQDHTPPVTICDQHTAIGVTNDGYAHVPANVFDDGSYDECQLDRMLVRRMDTDRCGDCPRPVFTGFDYLGEYNGHHYYLSDEMRNGQMAYKHSKALGGYAVSLETPEENNWFMNALPENTNVYIGARGNYTYNHGVRFDWESGAEGGYAYYYPNYAFGDEFDFYAYFNSDYGYWDFNDGYTPMRYVIEIEDPCGFSEYTQFCCNDIGKENMVVFRTVDAACNFNECMVNADVQDKIGPNVVCPDNRVVSCDTAYDINDLSQFGEPTVFDNCGFTISERVEEDFNQCHVGTLKRTFIVTDDGGRVDSCTQTIYFEYDFSFDEDDILAPADTTINTGCSDPNSPEYSTAALGLPTYPNTPCQLLGVNVEDQVFIFNDQQTDACFKILRTFTIINWCETDYYGLPETYTRVQVIKINNTVAPVIEACERVTVCTYDPECNDGAVTLTKSATDDCTDALHWSYQIDANNDGVYDFVPVTGVGNTADASGTYPIGSHRITWTFWDRCGNVTTCDQLFDVVNCKSPTPYCLSGISTDLMPQDTDNDGEPDAGMIDIWAKDFDKGSYHPCGYPVVLSFSQDTSDTVRFFDCSHVAEDQEVRLYATAVTPDGQLLQAFCVTSIDIQDNMNVCSGDNANNGGGETERFVISGAVSTAANQMLDEVKVELIGSESYQMTADGAYAFPEMPENNTYTVDPTKNDDVNNGVSTLDLVHIQRHVIGLEELGTNYQRIAADINNDKTISASDVVELRKVILGLKDEFDTNESWKFVDASYEFSEGDDAWTQLLPENYNITALNADMEINFTAIKVGDVNNSVELNVNSNTAETRSSMALTAEVELVNGVARVPVYADQATELAALQMTMDLTSEFISIESALLEVTDNNVGLRYADRGLVTFSWDNMNGVTVEKGDHLFTIVMAESATNAINVTSDITKAEAANTSYEAMSVTMNTRSSNVEEFALMQNTPNPFNEYTEVSFVLPSAMSATVTVFDMNGRTLYNVSDNYEKGLTTIRLTRDDLPASGVLYYQIEAGDFTASKKMVVFN